MLTYGCETSIMNKQQKSKVQAADMKGSNKSGQIKDEQIRCGLGVQLVLEYLHRVKNTGQTKRI